MRGKGLSIFGCITIIGVDEFIEVSQSDGSDLNVSEKNKKAFNFMSLQLVFIWFCNACAVEIEKSKLTSNS